MVRRSLSGRHGRGAQRRRSDLRRPGGQLWGVVICGEGSGHTLGEHAMTHGRRGVDTAGLRSVCQLNNFLMAAATLSTMLVLAS